MSASVSPGVLRRICAAWPSGVAVVTAVDQHGRPVGMAVNSFTSVSLDLVCGGVIRHERSRLVFHDGSMGALAPRLAC